MKWTLAPIPSVLEPVDDLAAIDPQPLELETDDIQVPGVGSVRGIHG